MQHQFQTETSGNSVTHQATFGARLRGLRIQRRISLVGFARQVGVSKPTVWKWERDEARPRQKSIEAAASILGVSEQELIFGGSLEPARPGGSALPQHLGDVVSACKEQIAMAAGTSADRVLVTIQV